MVNIKDTLIKILKEEKEKGNQAVPVSYVIKRVIEEINGETGKQIYPQSVNNVIRMLELNGVIKTFKNTVGRKIIDLKESKI